MSDFPNRFGKFPLGGGAPSPVKGTERPLRLPADARKHLSMGKMPRFPAALSGALWESRARFASQWLSSAGVLESLGPMPLAGHHGWRWRFRRWRWQRFVRERHWRNAGDWFRGRLRRWPGCLGLDHGPSLVPLIVPYIPASITCAAKSGAPCGKGKCRRPSWGDCISIDQSRPRRARQAGAPPAIRPRRGR